MVWKYFSQLTTISPLSSDFIIQSLSPWRILLPPLLLLPPYQLLPLGLSFVHHVAVLCREPPTAPVSRDTPSPAETATPALVFNQTLITNYNIYDVSVWDVYCVRALCISDIDECELFHNGQAGRLCLHACVNTPGGYRCSCPAGYNVTRDGRSCKGAHTIFLFFLNLLIYRVCSQPYSMDYSVGSPSRGTWAYGVRRLVLSIKYVSE